MKISSDDLERAARAIYESVFLDEWVGGDGIEAELYRQSARAAAIAFGLEVEE